MFKDALNRAKRNLDEFNVAINNPVLAQRYLFEVLSKDYCKTDYSESYGLKETISIDEFRKRIPIADYYNLKQLFQDVRKGDYRALLGEEPFTWNMTRGTTGASKIIPVTETHMHHIVRGGSRAVLNAAFNMVGLEPLIGGVLNLQFPSNNQTMRVGKEEIVFGFSSGTYARLNPMLAGLRLIPRQEEIDA